MDLICENLRFSYGSQDLIRISRFSLRETAGITWIRGSSGSGKSTFLGLLAGLLKPKSGRILWGEAALSDWDESERNRFRLQNIGYMQQENQMINHWTVEQNLQLVSDDENLVSKYLQIFQFPKDSQQKCAQVLSGGERQRLSLIQTLLKKPKIALLDEPTAHLDEKNVKIFIELLQTELKNSFVLIVSHDSRLEKFLDHAIDFSDINR